MDFFEILIGIAIITNTILQFGDIVICRFTHCGKSSKNSTAPRAVTPSEDFPTQSVGAPEGFVSLHVNQHTSN